MQRARESFQKVRDLRLHSFLICGPALLTSSPPPQGLKITKEMVAVVASRLRQVGVRVLIAPYEADAQVRPLQHPSTSIRRWALPSFLLPGGSFLRAGHSTASTSSLPHLLLLFPHTRLTLTKPPRVPRWLTSAGAAWRTVSSPKTPTYWSTLRCALRTFLSSTSGTRRGTCRSSTSTSRPSPNLKVLLGGPVLMDP